MPTAKAAGKHCGDNRGDKIGTGCDQPAAIKAAGKRKEGHDKRGNDENRPGRQKTDRPTDPLNLFAKLGLGEIDLVLEELRELRKCIAEQGRDRPKIGFCAHDAHLCRSRAVGRRG